MRLTAADYEGLLDNENVQRALHSIRSTEGTATRADPYSVGFGFSTIADLSKHPNERRGFRQTNGKRNTTNAAGAYQFMTRTWNELQTRLGLPDFGPKSQDIAAIAKIDERGALQNVLDGDVKGFVNKIGNEWVSMPSAPKRYSQPKKSYNFVEQAWTSYGKPPKSVPTPKAAPYGLLSTPEVVAASSVPAGLLSASPSQMAQSQPRNVPTPTARPGNTGLVPTVERVADRGPRVISTPRNVPTPTGRPTSLMANQGVAPQPDPGRFGTNMPMQAPASLTNQYAANKGLKSGRVAPQGVPQSFGLNPTQQANLDARLGTYDTVQPSMAQYGRTPAQPTRTATATGLLGISPAAASEMPTGGLLSAPAPSAGFAGAAGSPRSMEGRLPAAALGGLLSPAAPRNVPAPTARPGMALATPTPRPSMPAAPTAAPPAYDRSRIVADASRVAPPTRTQQIQTPSPRAAPTRPASDAWGGLRNVTAPQVSEPMQPQRSFGQKLGVVGGALAGGAIGGPVGGLLGGAIGSRLTGGGFLDNPLDAVTGEDRRARDAQKPERSWQQKAAVIGAATIGSAVAGPVGGLLGGVIGNQIAKGGLLGGSQRPAQTQGNGGYATSLPSRPAAPTKSQRDALDRDLAARGGMGRGGPSISKGARDAIGAEKAAGKGPGGLW